MLQKAPDKLICIKGYSFSQPCRLVVFIGKCHHSAIVLKYPVVGDGHTMSVIPEIIYKVINVRKRFLAVDNPFSSIALIFDLFKARTLFRKLDITGINCLFEQSAQNATEHGTEGIDWYKELFP